VKPHFPLPDQFVEEKETGGGRRGRRPQHAGERKFSELPPSGALEWKDGREFHLLRAPAPFPSKENWLPMDAAMASGWVQALPLLQIYPRKSGAVRRGWLDLDFVCGKSRDVV